jgi:hypothetical protein
MHFELFYRGFSHPSINFLEKNYALILGNGFGRSSKNFQILAEEFQGLQTFDSIVMKQISKE